MLRGLTRAIVKKEDGMYGMENGCIVTSLYMADDLYGFLDCRVL